jgi:two-component system chemotaxis response regulator CheY
LPARAAQPKDAPMSVNMNMPILIVDDYKTMLRIIRNLLTQIGFDNVEEASDGATALAKLHERPFGLVISDWNMEPMSGIDLLREVRADDALKSLPFIMVTAESKSHHVVDAREAGVSNYIVKPFNAATLKRKLATVLGGF